MCLERCNATAADIAASVKEFTSHAHTLTAVSFEVWLRCCCSELVTRCHINASWLAGLQPRPALHTCCQQSHACSGLVAKGGVDDTADDILVPVRRTTVCTGNLLASPLLCMWAATRRSSCRGCGKYGLTPRPSSMTACRSTWWWGCGHALLLNNSVHGFARAAAQGFSGFNVDWEPASGTITPQDPLE